MREYVPPGMNGHVNVVPPAIDPLTPKNMALSPEDGAFVCGQFGIDVDRPLMCQVSRFDPWKDPLGVIDAYRIVKESMPEVQLALVGSMASDDPEGWDFFNATIAHADGDPDIHILNNFNNVGAIEVNAFQSHSDVLIQKSTREGFGLTVSEAIWKARPFIGGNVGGIPLQIEDGVTGFLVSSVEECAARSLEVLKDPALGKFLGRRGKEHVRTHFLTPRYLRDYLKIFTALKKESSGGRHVEHERDAVPLVLVSNRGPVTFEADGSTQRGSGGVVTALTGLATHREAIWIASAMSEYDAKASREHDGRAVPRALADRRRRLPRAPGRLRPGRLRPLLQRRRQPDAVVHPALPVGPVERSGHPPRGDRGVRVRLQRRQRRPRRGRHRRARGQRGTGRDDPRLPPLHAARPGPPRAPRRVPAPLHPHPLDAVRRLARAADADPRGDLHGPAWRTTSSAFTRAPTGATSCSAAAT